MEAAGIITVVKEPEKPAETTDEGSNVVTYDDEGVAKGIGRTTLLNKGFTEGMQVKEKTAETLDQFKITDIGEDGAVTLAKVLVEDGSIDTEQPQAKVDLNKFLDTYKPCKEIKYLKNYPANDCMNDSEHKLLGYKCMAMQALIAMLAKFKSPSVRIMTSPTSGVYATKDYKKGDLLVLPMVSDLSKLTVELDKKVRCPPKQIVVKFSEKGAPRVFIAPQAASEEFVAMFWSIGGTDKKAGVNLVFDEKVVQMRMPSLSAKNTNELIDITVPVLVNNKAVKVDDELRVFKEVVQHAEAVKRVLPALTSTRASKASRTD